MTFKLLGALFAVAEAVKISSTPGQLFDLSRFNIELPINNNGRITVVRQPKLANYTDNYFYTNEDNDAMIMFAPENAVKTKGGAGPRTELAEPLEYFTFNGTHKMSYVTTIL